MTRDSIIFLSLVCIIHILCIAQTQERDLRQIIVNIKEMPYDPPYTGDAEFWEMVSQGKSIVPDLTKLLLDTAQTEAMVPLTGGNYAVADIAYAALGKIIHDLPTYHFISVSDEIYDHVGVAAYWNFVRAGVSNRKILQYEFTKWYNQNRDRLIWISDTAVVHDGHHDSPLKHPAGGYYRLEGVDKLSDVPLKSGVWLGGGFGFCNYGPTFQGGITLNIQGSLYYLRYLKADELSPLLPSENVKFYDKRINEISFLYGRKFQKENKKFCYFAGISFITSKKRGDWIDNGYEDIQRSYVGITAEGQFIYKMAETFGFLMSISTNMNNERPHNVFVAGITLDLL